MTGLNGDAIEWLTERVLEALERADNVGPFALMLILRRYCATGRADLADALGQALARASEPHAFGNDNEADHPAWLMLLVEAASVSDDERLCTAAANLVISLRQRWGRLQLVEPVMSSIEACLMAAGAEVFTSKQLLPETLVPEPLVQDAIDELERVVAAAYRPGSGMADRTHEPRLRGRLADQVRPASTLLTAYSRTGRLPYAMLAEELLQFASRTLWDDESGGFFDEPAVSTDVQPSNREEHAGSRAKPFALNCEAARVLWRLAGLHDSSEYRQIVVVAPGVDHGGSAARTLAAVEPSYRLHGVNGAIYGVALGEWLARP